MIYLILLFLTFILQLFFVSWYIMQEGIKGRQRSVGLKSLCCFMYFSDVLLSGAIAGDFKSPYFLAVLGGLAVCFIGDIFLNLEFNAAFLIGMAAFLGGHLFYIFAFSQKLEGSFGVQLFNVTDISVSIGLFAVFLLLSFKKDLFDFKKMRIPVTVYSAVILFMTVKAVHLGVLLQSTGIADYQSMSFLTVCGALSFTVSDVIILFMFFGGKNSRRSSLINAYLYFFGQMLLACTTLYGGK